MDADISGVFVVEPVGDEFWVTYVTRTRFSMSGESDDGVTGESVGKHEDLDTAEKAAKFLNDLLSAAV